MANDLYLRLAGTAASYFLQVFAGWLTCVGITRLSRSPRLRFFVWQSFVSVAAAYWIFRARSVWIAESAAPHAAVNSSKPQLYRILVPHAWLGGATAKDPIRRRDRHETLPNENPQSRAAYCIFRARSVWIAESAKD